MAFTSFPSVPAANGTGAVAPRPVIVPVTKVDWQPPNGAYTFRLECGHVVDDGEPCDVPPPMFAGRLEVACLQCTYAAIDEYAHDAGRRGVQAIDAGLTPLNMANALAHNEWSAATTENPVDPITHAVIAAKLFQHTLDAVPLQQRARIDMKDLLDVMIQQIRGEL